MIRLLYITSSSYSGSTLLSFLLNAHPEIVTVGEADGWNYGQDEVFLCSCGAPLSTCPFFQTVAAAFREEGLPFDPRNFGTRYQLAGDARWNRYLTAEPPYASEAVEGLRDWAVGRIPPFARRLARQDRANIVLARTALETARAKVFVDASKNPYRLRHLRRSGEFDIHVLHLVRDPRGVSLSNMKKKGFPADLTVRLWLHEQRTIARVVNEFPKRLVVYYEDLCDAVDDTLGTIQDFVGVPRQPAPADFKDVEHHILGNEMRLRATDAISKDLRWTRELTATDRYAIEQACLTFCRRYGEHSVAEIVARYRSDAPVGYEGNDAVTGTS